jgi:proteasome activator subunit 4
MSELSDNPELQKYGSSVLRVLSSVYLPPSLTHVVLDELVSAIQSSEVFSFTTESGSSDLEYF